MLIQRSAAAAATSSTAAPPISVSTNSRRGVCRLRAQAVRPEYGAVSSAVVMGVDRRVRVRSAACGHV